MNISESLNVCDEYCGPLSVTTISGIPCRANMGFRLFAIEAEEVLFNLAISTNADR